MDNCERINGKDTGTTMLDATSSTILGDARCLLEVPPEDWNPNRETAATLPGPPTGFFLAGPRKPAFLARLILLAGDVERNPGPNTKKPNSNRTLKIIQINVEGIRSKKTELSNLIHLQDADIICAQETDLQENCDFFINGYNIIRSNRTRGRILNRPTKGGGTLIAIKDNIKYDRILTPPITAIDDTTEWTAVCIFPDTSAKNHIDIYNLYAPPINSGAEDDREETFNLQNLQFNPNTLVVGDFNAHHPLWSSFSERSNTRGDTIFDWCMYNRASILNKENVNTHLHRASGSQSSPDLTICHAVKQSKSTWTTLESIGSDHLPILVTLHWFEKTHNLTKTKVKSWKKADWHLYRMITEEKFSEWTTTKPTNLKSAFHLFCKTITRADSEAIPSGTVKRPAPWWNEKAKEAVRNRNEARKKAHLSDAARTEWNNKNKECKRIIIQEKTKSWKEYATSLSMRSDPSKVSKVIKSLTPGNTHARTANILKVNNKTKTSNKDIANEYMKEYAMVSHLQQDKRDRLLKKVINKKLKEPCNNCDNNKISLCSPFSLSDLDRALKDLQLGKAAGDDNISNDHLKNLGAHGKNALLHIANLSWKKGLVLNEWKVASIVPILKNGKPEDKIGSYRPISLLSCTGKLVERLIQARLYWWLEKNNNLCPEQAGFRKKRSTTDQIARLKQVIHDGYQQKPPKKSYVLLFDMRRAYDTVWHNALLSKLTNTNIPTCAVRWIKSFLEQRAAKVRINSTNSKPRTLHAGVPQGSVLAPLLFDVFVNDLPTYLPSNVHTFMFADDLAVVVQASSLNECTATANTVTSNVSQWANDWRMCLAPEKCVASVFSTCHGDANFKPTIKINDHTIEIEKHPCFLGVMLDRLFSATHHTKNAKTKARNALSILSRLAGTDFGSNMKDLEIMYNTFVKPRIEYAAEAWLPGSSKSAIESLNVIQRAAARLITGATRNTNKEVLEINSNMMPYDRRAKLLAGKYYQKAIRQPDNHPIRRTAEASCRTRLKSIHSWREIGRDICAEAGLTMFPSEDLMPIPSFPPWSHNTLNVSFGTKDINDADRSSNPERRKNDALRALDQLPHADIITWTDGSVVGGTTNGGSGILIEYENGDVKELSYPAGSFSSSFRAEKVAIHKALMELDNGETVNKSIRICTDSLANVLQLKEGPHAQKDLLAISIWSRLVNISSRPNDIYIQWVPGHSNIEGNERADHLAKIGNTLPQDNVPIDYDSAIRALTRKSNNDWTRCFKDKANPSNSTKWFIEATNGKPSNLLHPSITRRTARIIEQLKMGKSYILQETKCEIGAATSPLCPHCGSNANEDSRHYLLHCPRWTSIRQAIWGPFPTPEEVFQSDHRLEKYLRRTGHINL